MKRTVNVMLLIAVVFPIILLIWPFAEWNDTMSLMLRVIPSLAAQALFFRVGRWNIIKALPMMITGILGGWGTYLYFTSPHWINATVIDLFADYISPFICCIIGMLCCSIIKRKK